ncbi:MAG TPA: IS5 family transposase [Gemmatimonadaceae bacterium]|nr:IS5 family transposase [Gemmatimonadaceae bacterium]
MRSSYELVERHDLTEAEWRRLAPLLPAAVLNGILWTLATGALWRDLPPRYPPWPRCYYYFARWQCDGTWARVHRALERTLRAEDNAIDFALFCLDSTIVRAHKAPAGAEENRPPGEPADHALGRTRGGYRTKLSLVTDGQGLALAAMVHGGQASDLAAMPAILDCIQIVGARGRPRTYPDALTGDKGYSFAPVRR